RRPARRLRQRALERSEHRIALAPVQRARAHELLVDQAASLRLLEQPLAERAGALVRHLLRGHEPVDDAGRPGRPPEPEAGEQALRRRSGLNNDVRTEAPEARQRIVVEAQVAVGDVLDDQEAEAPRELDKCGPTIGSET